MSNRRRPRGQAPPDLHAGARLALLLSARADGCVCLDPVVALDDLDLSGDGTIVGRVWHASECPLNAAGPAAPHRLADLSEETDR